MRKIAFIGAGSFGFTRGLVRDILTFPALADTTIALMDIDQERLDFIKTAVDKIVEAGNYPAKVIATTDRAEALEGADGVALHHPAGRRRGLPHRHRDPEEVRRGHQHRRHPRPVGHLPRAADDSGDAGHLPATSSATARTRSSSTTPTRWRCSAARCRARPRSRSPASATASRARR